jgi:hypothetical protein
MQEPKGSPKRDVVLLRLNDGVAGQGPLPRWYIEVETGFDSHGKTACATKRLAGEYPGRAFVSARLCPAVTVNSGWSREVIYPDWLAGADNPRATGYPRSGSAAANVADHVVLLRMEVETEDTTRTCYLQARPRFRLMSQAKEAARRAARRSPGSVYVAATLRAPMLMGDVVDRVEIRQWTRSEAGWSLDSSKVYRGHHMFTGYPSLLT